MRGIACVLLVLAACGDDGTPTEAASLMGTTMAVKSAYSKSFNGVDGSGAAVLGWKVDFVNATVGTGCKADGVKVIAKIASTSTEAPSGRLEQPTAMRV